MLQRLGLVLLWTNFLSNQAYWQNFHPVLTFQRFYMSRSMQGVTDLRVARSIVDSFQANRFQPSSFWTSSEHYQTIVGSGALSGKFGKPPSRPFETTSESFNTPDGDVFEVEYTLNFEKEDDVVIILHGLESSPKSVLVTRFATAFLEKKFSCVLFGFRGCSGTLPR